MEHDESATTGAELLDELLVALEDLERLMAKRDVDQDFNVFELLGIVDAETRHSRVIAWLMDPHGGHGLDGRILGALIEHAGGMPPENLDGFTVRREADHVDILAISKEDHMTLAIENKVWSSEHSNQLSRYHRLIESRYRGWDNQYLYLTPNGDAPESDEDAANWEPLSYSTLIGIVDAAMDAVQPSAKAKMLAADYLECIRRHIVGDEELSERCIEIYSQHKRAIDLIMENLPDTAKTVHDYARDWAERHEGPKVVKECSGGRGYVRFRTKRLNEHFPYRKARDSWGQHRFWFYELITKKTSDGLGCTLKLQLCFNHPKWAKIPENDKALMVAFTEAFAQESGRTFAAKSFTGYESEEQYYTADSASFANVADVCDKLWEDFLNREEKAIKAVFEQDSE